MKQKTRETIQYYFGMFIGVVLVIALFITGYMLRGSDLDYKFEACDEYCFHYPEKPTYANGWLWNESKCICSDGTIGWFK